MQVIVLCAVIGVLGVQAVGGIVAQRGVGRLILQDQTQPSEPSERTWVRAPEQRDATACAGWGADEVCSVLPSDPGLERQLVDVGSRSGRVRVEAACHGPRVADGRDEMIATLPSRRLQWPGVILWRSDVRFGLRIATAAVGDGARPQFALPVSRADGDGRCSAAYDRGVITLRWEGLDARRTATLRLGVLEGWLLWRSIRYVTPSVVGRARASAAVALGLGIGLALATLVSAAGRAAVYAGALGGAIVLAVDVMLIPGVDVGGAVMVALVAAGGAALGSESGLRRGRHAVVAGPGR